MRWFLLRAAAWPPRHLRRFILCAIASYSIAYSAQFIPARPSSSGGNTSISTPTRTGSVAGLCQPRLDRSSRQPSAPPAHRARSEAPAPLARGRWRSPATLSVIATGARGRGSPGVVLHAHTARAICLRAPRPRADHRAVIAIVALPIAWIALGEQIQSRIDEGRWEIKEALENKDYSTSTGARINMWIWAGRAFAANPILGTGTGGYEMVRDARAEMGIRTTISPSPATHWGVCPYRHSQAGGSWALGAMIAAFLLQCWPRGDDRTYRAGLVGAVIAVLFAGIFATAPAHTQTAAVLSGFAALSMRPSNRS